MYYKTKGLGFMEKLRIILNGAGGRMGTVAANYINSAGSGAALCARVDPAGGDGICVSLWDCNADADVIIDFSHRGAAGDLAKYAAARKLPLVVCTTGYREDDTEKLRRAARSVPVFISSNMSRGASLLQYFAAFAAEAFPEADIEIVEMHHRRKADSPSGTALMLAEGIRRVRPRSYPAIRGSENGRAGGEIGIHSIRIGSCEGVHTVILSDGTETLTLCHRAEDRSVFAVGAVSAARYIAGRRPGIYNMQNMLGI